MRRYALAKSVISILIVLILSTPLTEARKPRNSVFQKSIAADRAWPTFFKRLRIAVKQRDRTRLKAMMDPEFHYSLGHHAQRQKDDWREDAFKYWDNPYNPGWRALDRTLAKGAVPMAAWWRAGNEKKSPPSRVAPPAANIRWKIDRDLVSYLVIFEYRKGRWYFTSFDMCCD
jgi:hypothetical protein